MPIDELPDHLVKAVLATEDRRFFEHFGIDFLGLFRAMSENARAGGVVQGGSTLTQQLAKNLFLTNERSFDRKIKEAFLALWLEANMTKKEILSLYLDRAYMGGGTFGAAAAARLLFRQELTDLTLAESRNARRPVQGAGEICAACQPAGGARPRQRGSDQPRPERVDDRGPGHRRPPPSGDRRRPQTKRSARFLPRLGL